MAQGFLCVVMSLRKTLRACFALGQSSLPVVEAQPVERLANRIQISALRWCGWTEAARLAHMNKRTKVFEELN